MRKSEVLSETGIEMKQLRDAWEEWGIIAKPDKQWLPNQLSPVSEYAADTVERLRIVQSVSPHWVRNHLLDWIAGAEELALRGNDLPPRLLRAVSLRWLHAEKAGLIGRRHSALVIPADSREEGWESVERKSIARAMPRRTAALPPVVVPMMKAFAYAQAGVAQTGDIPGVSGGLPIPPDVEASIDRLIDEWQSLDDESIVRRFRKTRVFLADNAGLFDRALPYFIALPPSMRADDLSSLVLAGVGHTCKYHHPIAQTMLPGFVLHMLPTLRAVDAHPAASQRQSGMEQAAAHAVRFDIGTLLAGMLLPDGSEVESGGE